MVHFVLPVSYRRNPPVVPLSNVVQLLLGLAIRRPEILLKVKVAAEGWEYCPRIVGNIATESWEYCRDNIIQMELVY